MGMVFSYMLYKFITITLYLLIKCQLEEGILAEI